jgi:hypothetical protein
MLRVFVDNLLAEIVDLANNIKLGWLYQDKIKIFLNGAVKLEGV